MTIIVEDGTVFQSTPPRGRRLPDTYAAVKTGGFNPRPPVGGDGPDQIDVLDSIVSIHAPPWEATGWSTMSLGSIRFNPRPPVGGDPYLWSACAGVEFQSTPPRGRRLPGSPYHISLEWFQSTPPRGRRPRLVRR